MTFLRALLIAALAAGICSAPALADPPRDANRAFQGVRQGRIIRRSKDKHDR
jgi:hypothetical protein